MVGEDGLQSELGNPLLPPAPPHRRARPFTAEERACSLGVPGAALVVADAPGPRCEEGITDRVESLAGDEDDELAVQMFLLRAQAPAIRAPAKVTLESGWRRGVAPGTRALDPRTGRSGRAAASPSSRRRSTSTRCRSRAPPARPRDARCRSPSCRRTGDAPPPPSCPR